MSGVFIGRNRTIDFVYDPMSIIVAHSRFTKIRPYLLDLIWVGVPVVHNSPIIRELGGIAEVGYYEGNELKEGRMAFERVVQNTLGLEGLIELRKKIIQTYTPISVEIQNAWDAAATTVAPLKVDKSVLTIGFCDMWDEFNPAYNMFTLMLEAARPGKKVVGVAAVNSQQVFDVLFFGPFGETWKQFPETLPKIHFTGENTGPVVRDDVKLNIGFKHVDADDKSYLRIPLWMLEINWFRADAGRIGNPKPLPIDSCCKVEAAAASRSKPWGRPAGAACGDR